MNWVTKDNPFERLMDFMFSPTEIEQEKYKDFNP